MVDDARPIGIILHPRHLFMAFLETTPLISSRPI
jgi:hypothetical protein